MAFQFTLNGLLRLRESLEKAELQRLQSIAGAAALTRAEIESLEKFMEAERRRTSDTVVTSGLTGAELHLEIVKQSGWKELHSQLLKKLFDLEQKRKEQQARYVQARMQREIVSNLFKRQFAEYELDRSRREQQRIDELFLIRSTPSAKSAKPASDEESR